MHKVNLNKYIEYSENLMCSFGNIAKRNVPKSAEICLKLINHRDGFRSTSPMDHDQPSQETILAIPSKGNKGIIRMSRLQTQHFTNLNKAQNIMTSQC